MHQPLAAAAVTANATAAEPMASIQNQAPAITTTAVTASVGVPAERCIPSA
jgi:hypothetical protein